VCRQRQVDVHQLLDLLKPWRSDLEALGKVALRLRRYLPDPVRLLLAEAETEPGFDEGGVADRNERVVAVASLVDPALRGMGVEVADRLGFLDGVSGYLDPDVRSPDFIVSPVPEEEAECLPTSVRDRSGCARPPELLDLDVEVHLLRE
jgi:hypothetical protein